MLASSFDSSNSAHVLPRLDSNVVAWLDRLGAKASYRECLPCIYRYRGKINPPTVAKEFLKRLPIASRLILLSCAINKNYCLMLRAIGLMSTLRQIKNHARLHGL